MKHVRELFCLGILLTVLALFACSSYSQSSNSAESLVDRRVAGLDTTRANIHLMASYLANELDIPIGLEIAPSDDLTRPSELRLVMRDVTVRNVLDSIITQNSLYSWKVRDGVVNIFPKDRDRCVRDVMEAQIAALTSDNKMSGYNLRLALTDLPEIKTVIARCPTSVNSEFFPGTLSMTPVKDRAKKNLKLEVHNLAFVSVLNKILTESSRRYWIVDRPKRNPNLFVNF